MNLWSLVPIDNDIWQRRIAEIDMAAPVFSLGACARFISFNLENYFRFDPFCYIVQYEEGVNFYIDLTLGEINLFSHEFRVYTRINDIPKQLDSIHQFLLSGFQILIINEIQST